MHESTSISVTVTGFVAWPPNMANQLMTLHLDPHCGPLTRSAWRERTGRPKVHLRLVTVEATELRVWKSMFRRKPGRRDIAVYGTSQYKRGVLVWSGVWRWKSCTSCAARQLLDVVRPAA